MKVLIKEFDVQMEVKNKGIELSVYSADGSEQLGDLVVTKTGVIWCKGRTSRKNGIKVSWNHLIESIEAKKND